MKCVYVEWGMVIVSLISFFAAGMSVVWMSPGNYVPGVVFWGCLIVGITLQVVLSIRCRHLQKETGITSKQSIGLLSFFKNFYGMAADLITAIALIAFVLSITLNGGLQLKLILVALIVSGFSMHCICNGKNVDLLTRIARRKRRYRQANREEA